MWRARCDESVTGSAGDGALLGVRRSTAGRHADRGAGGIGATYSTSVVRAKAVLKEDLFRPRDAIDKCNADNARTSIFIPGDGRILRRFPKIITD
jgi:hypothetical protein